MNRAAITAATVLAAIALTGLPNMGTGAVETTNSANTSTGRTVALEHNLRRELRTARAQLRTTQRPTKQVGHQRGSPTRRRGVVAATSQETDTWCR